MSNEMEYFAEAVSSFFNVERLQSAAGGMNTYVQLYTLSCFLLYILHVTGVGTGGCKVRNNYHHNHFLFCSSRFLINLTPHSHTWTLSICFRRHCMYNHRVYNRIVIRLTWAVEVLVLFTFMAFLYFSLDVVMDYAIMKTNPRIT